MTNTNFLAWIDLEMTGLDPEKHHIIEIGSLITDGNLNIVEEGPNIAISQQQDVLDLMDEWNVNQHSKTGLIELIKKSEVNIKEAELKTLEFFKKHLTQHASPLCGSSISHDRRFLIKYMPKLANHFHYRHIDVTSFKESLKRWDKDFVEYKKKASHRAMDDIRESVEELRYYKEKYIK
ncbi:oligoribonuclease [SAR86 cluster bacterium]|jgi:oligoribonuclease|nr:oligoribonuclease [SAR86 cluster bacterium]|tara:strand:+ start:905 stop:1441 length:537 start_codon:yes stop_codon:yes gene_type:complete